MKKTALIFPALTLASLQIFAQGDADALRYSMISFGGPARSVGAGGSFGALGADLSVLSTNPAGMALYRRSEITLTPYLFRKNSSSLFLGQRRSEDRYNFGFSNAGMVLAYVSDGNSASDKWKGISLGFAYNRQNDFHSRTLWEGVNTDNSLLDHYLERVNNSGSGTYPSQLASYNAFNANLAWETYLIDTVPGDSAHYFTLIPNAGETQKRLSTSSGSLGEYAVTFAGNYSDRLYFGATLGIPVLNYEEQVTYEETDKADTIAGFKSFRLHENLTTSGSGLNLKLGMIARISEWLRIGAAVHTPTFFDLKDEFSSGMTASHDNGNSYTADSPKGSFQYSLATPMRLTGSVGITLQKRATFGVEYELVDYSEARLRSSGDNFNSANDNVQMKYGAAGNLRAGTEVRFDPYSFRLGYALYGSPFRSGMAYPGADMSRTSYTGGFGIRDEDYYLDLAYVYTASSEYYRMYSLKTESVPGAVTDTQSHSLLMTLGWKF